MQWSSNRRIRGTSPKDVFNRTNKRIPDSKGKRIQRAVVKKDLHHELYKECLFQHKQMRHTQVVIRSREHQIGVYEQNKISLSPLDTKKWIAGDGITTRAYGHFRI